MKAIALLLVLSGSAMAGGLVQGGATPPSAALSENTITASTLTVSSQLSGSIWFSTTSGRLSQDNANLFYTFSGGPRLGLGTAGPATLLHLSSGTLTVDGGTAAITSSGAYTGTGVNGHIISASSITTTGGVFGATGVFGTGATHSTFTATGSLSVLATQGGANTPAANFSPALSSFTTTGTSGLTGTFNTTTLSTCVAGSTVSLNLPITGNVAVYFNGAMSNASLNGLIMVGVMVDGTYVNGETSAKGLTMVKEQVATDNNNMSFSAIVTGLASGTHNFCLAVAATFGTATIDNTNSIATLSVYMLP